MILRVLNISAFVLLLSYPMLGLSQTLDKQTALETGITK